MMPFLNALFRRRLAGMAFVTIFAASAGPASAQVMQAQAKALAQVCRSDFNRFCPNVQPGGGRVIACLQSHASELSAPCRDSLPKAEELKAKASASGALPK